MQSRLRSMQRVTVTLTDDQVRELDAQQRLGNADLRSGAVRYLLDEQQRLASEYAKLRTEYEACREELEQRERRIKYLEEQLAERSRVEEKVDDLVAAEDDVAPPWPVRWWRYFRR